VFSLGGGEKGGRGKGPNNQFGKKKASSKKGDAGGTGDSGGGFLGGEGKAVYSS